MMNKTEFGTPMVEEQAMFGTTGEHSVGFVGSLRHQIIDKNSNV